MWYKQSQFSYQGCLLSLEPGTGTSRFYWHAQNKGVKSLYYLQNLWVQALPYLKEFHIKIQRSCLNWMEETFDKHRIILPGLEVFSEASSDSTITPTVQEGTLVHPGNPLARHVKDSDKFPTYTITFCFPHSLNPLLAMGQKAPVTQCLEHSRHSINVLLIESRLRWQRGQAIQGSWAKREASLT